MSDMQKKFETDEGVFLYATGVLSSDVYGLALNKNGVFVTPAYRVDEEKNVQAYMQEDGKPIPLYSFKFDGKKKIVKQPKMEGKEKLFYLLLRCDNGKDEKPTFYRIEARGETAIEMNMYYQKFDKVSIVAKLNYSIGIETGRKEPVWVIKDIKKVKDSFVKKEDIKYKEEYEN